MQIYINIHSHTDLQACRSYTEVDTYINTFKKQNKSIQICISVLEIIFVVAVDGDDCMKIH